MSSPCIQKGGALPLLPCSSAPYLMDLFHHQPRMKGIIEMVGMVTCACDLSHCYHRPPLYPTRDPADPSGCSVFTFGCYVAQRHQITAKPGRRCLARSARFALFPFELLVHLLHFCLGLVCRIQPGTICTPHRFYHHSNG